MYNILIPTGFLMAPVHSVSVEISIPGPFSAMEPGRMMLTGKPYSNHFSGIPRSTGSILNCYSPERSIKEDFSGLHAKNVTSMEMIKASFSEV